MKNFTASKIILGFGCLLLATSCSNNTNNHDSPLDVKIEKISPDMVKVRDYVPKNAVIAHRGTAHYAPEETEAAYRWAREAGADYLEGDLQLTKDNVIIFMHDDNMIDKTDVAKKFPDRGTVDDKGNKIYRVKDFTYKELLQLDNGSWFNNPDRQDVWRSTFAGSHILRLQDVAKIAEGYNIIRDKDGNVTGYVRDTKWKGNRPGLYIETKEPRLNPEGKIEERLYKELTNIGWNIITKPATDTEFYKNGFVNVGNTNGKIVLQTFSSQSLENLHRVFQDKLPMCQLLWLDPNDPNYSMVADTPEEFAKWINHAVENGAVFMGPSIPEKIKEGEDKSSTYADLLSDWREKLMHEADMGIHPYTFDKQDTMDKFYQLSDGMFTNLAVESINYYAGKGKRTGAPKPETVDDIFNRLGYTK